MRASSEIRRPAGRAGSRGRRAARGGRPPSREHREAWGARGSARPERGVALDDLELLVGQLRRLPQDASGTPTLPTSCSIPASRTRSTLLLGQAELLGHHRGVATDRLRVPRAAAEAQVDGLGQLQHDGDETLAGDVARPPLARDASRSAVLCRTDLSRPLSLAANSAASAARSSEPAVSPSSGWPATPKLIVTRRRPRRTPCAQRRAGARRSRSASCRSVSGRTSANPRRRRARDRRSGASRVEHAREPLQRVSATWWPERSLHFLEVVHVADDQRDLAAAAPRALELEVEQLAKAAPVGELREGVGARGVVERSISTRRARASSGSGSPPRAACPSRPATTRRSPLDGGRAASSAPNATPM